MSGKEIPGSESVTWQGDCQNERPPDLRFLHFNDVYHIGYDASKQFPMPGVTKTRTD